MALQAALPEALTTNLRPLYQIRHRANRPQHQRTPASRRDRGGQSAAEESAALAVRPKPTIDDNRPASTHLQADATPPKSRKASSRSASRVGIAIKAISNSLHRNHVWFAAEASLTRIIFGSLSPRNGAG
jgi:hypothetical protein